MKAALAPQFSCYQRLFSIATLQTAGHLLPSGFIPTKRPTSAGRRIVTAGRPTESQVASSAGKSSASDGGSDMARLAQSNTMRARMGLAPEAAASSQRRGSTDGKTPAPAPSAGGGTTAATAASVFHVAATTLPMPLQALDLTACHRITDRALGFLGTNAPELEFVRLRLCDQASLSDAGLVALVQVRLCAKAFKQGVLIACCVRLACRDAQGWRCWTCAGWFNSHRLSWQP